MKDYKSYREQLLKCKENGNLITIDISIYGANMAPKKILVCVKYKSVCHSGVCKKERMSKISDHPNDVGC